MTPKSLTNDLQTPARPQRHTLPYPDAENSLSGHSGLNASGYTVSIPSDLRGNSITWMRAAGWPQIPKEVVCPSQWSDTPAAITLGETVISQDRAIRQPFQVLLLTVSFVATSAAFFGNFPFALATGICGFSFGFILRRRESR